MIRTPLPDPQATLFRGLLILFLGAGCSISGSEEKPRPPVVSTETRDASAPSTAEPKARRDAPGTATARRTAIAAARREERRIESVEPLERWPEENPRAAPAAAEVLEARPAGADVTPEGSARGSDGRSRVLYVVDQLPFEAGSAVLSARARSVLDQLVARLLLEDADYRLEIHSHAGDLESPDASGARARAVRAHLIDSRGVEPSHVDVVADPEDDRCIRRDAESPTAVLVLASDSTGNR